MVFTPEPVSREPGDIRDGAPQPPLPFSPLAIARERCKACELCVAACPKGLLTLEMTAVNGLGYHPIDLADPGRCTSCALCARVCPDAVFTVWAPPRGDR